MHCCCAWKASIGGMKLEYFWSLFDYLIDISWEINNRAAQSRDELSDATIGEPDPIYRKSA